ncbi:MAG: type II secretion system protein, partial [Methanocorpusculum sp.]|nr:type II secretion system protein [Methanocorpusculum sp.]
MKKVFKNRKGFSLAEMMIVVAIIAVLCSVGAVGISNYRKKLNQLHYDSNAEILFNAAQNRITELYAANGASVFQKYSGETTKRITSNGNREFLSESVSEDILGNHWAITFNPLTGIVYEAFYSEAVDSDGLTAAVIEKKNGFRANGAGTVGYYGIHDSESNIVNPEYPGTAYSSVPDYRCSLSIINKDILKARIELSHPGANLTITVRGKTTNESAVITADIPADKKTYEFVIDSVTTSFAKNSLFSAFIPGEDLEISVFATYGTSVTPTVSAVTNSLFAAKNGNIVTVRYGRHLQNLDAERFPATGAITAVIDKSIDFTDLSDANLWGSLYPGRNFDPISNSHISMLVASNTDGTYAERTIQGLKVDTT